MTVGQLKHYIEKWPKHFLVEIKDQGGFRSFTNRDIHCVNPPPDEEMNYGEVQDEGVVE